MGLDKDQDADGELDVGNRKGKKKGDGAGAATAGKVELTPAFIAYMNSIGASMQLISRILSEWSSLSGENLNRALAVFFQDMARASAQAQVQFDGRDFSLITSLFRSMVGREGAQVANKLTYEERGKPGPR